MEKIELTNETVRKEIGKMNTGGMKNIVILKDLPSNLVEEAIVFLKENQKLKKPELIDVEVNYAIFATSERSNFGKSL